MVEHLVDSGTKPATSPRLRVVVLISGAGSNLQALIDNSRVNNSGFDIVGVLSNKADAYGLQRAQQAQIASASVLHGDYDGRENFDRALIAQIDHWQADIVVLAGFMRILSSAFVSHYEGRLLNIHPSLLPKYKGLHTHQRALAAGDQAHGCSVHFVTPELDGGPVIAQHIVNIMPTDNVESLARRVHSVEHTLYSTVISWLASGRLRYEQGTPWLDDQPLNQAVRF